MISVTFRIRALLRLIRRFPCQMHLVMNTAKNIVHAEEKWSLESKLVLKYLSGQFLETSYVDSWLNQ
jgi:hypothetical protein